MPLKKNFKPLSFNVIWTVKCHDFKIKNVKSTCANHPSVSPTNNNKTHCSNLQAHRSPWWPLVLPRGPEPAGH